MYKEVDGNLITLAKEGKFNVIVHGCNCFCTMGAGIAKSIKEEFPAAYEEDLKTIKGDFRKLGNYSMVLDTRYSYPYLAIVNAYTQYNYGTDKIQLDYEALTLCLRKIDHQLGGGIQPSSRGWRQETIGLPKIGAGLAGGDWNRIKEIIQKELKHWDITVVNFKL